MIVSAKKAYRYLDIVNSDNATPKKTAITTQNGIKLMFFVVVNKSNACITISKIAKTP